MDRVGDYWELLVKLMKQEHRLMCTNANPTPGVELLLVIDPEQRIVSLQELGWRGTKRLRGAYIVVRIKDGKIWVEDDGTEEGIATKLLAAGVPKTDIVLAFLHPDRRRFSEFAVA